MISSGEFGRGRESVLMRGPVFFSPSRDLTIGEVADFTGASLLNHKHAKRIVTRLTSIPDAGEGALVFLESKKNLEGLKNITAAAVLCTEAVATSLSPEIAVLVTPNPRRDFSSVGRMLFPNALRPESWFGITGISPAAIIHPTAHVEAGATIEAGAVLGKNVVVGAGSLVSSSAVIGAGCQIGSNCYVAPGVSVQYAFIGNDVYLHPGTCVGQNGFDFVAGVGTLEKVPPLGRAVIEDDVEIGANTTVARGALGDTVICAGAKIDNLVQIAHSVRIGRGCLIAAHSSISGSSIIGDYTMLGGLVSVADSVVIGAGARVAAGSDVKNNIPDGERWGGVPARPLKQWFRDVVNVRDIERAKHNTQKLS